MTDLSYRPAVDADLPFIIDIYNRNIEALHGELRSYERWQEIFHSGSEYYIVENSGEVAWFRIDAEEDILDLAMVQVSPEHQHMGIGRFIVESFEKIAKEKVFHNLVIHTTEDNIPAKNLYLKCGYEVTEIDECTTADGATRMGYTFEKKI